MKGNIPLFLLVQDLEAIGIDQLGFRLKIDKAVKLLPPLHIDVQVPVRNIELTLNLNY